MFNETDRVYHFSLGFGTVITAPVYPRPDMAVVLFDKETYGETEYRVMVAHLEPESIQLARRAA